jgi:hypothetical protein
MKWLIILLILFISCSKEYEVPQIIKIEEGDHYCFPATIRSGKQIDWGYTFDLTKAKYCFNLFNPEEGKDWNKLVGVKKNYWVSEKDNYMIGFRSDGTKLEYCHYWNDSTGAFHWQDIPLNDEVVTVDFYHQNDSLIISLSGNMKSYYMPADETLNYTNTYFGGTYTAPSDLYFIRYTTR